MWVFIYTRGFTSVTKLTSYKTPTSENREREIVGFPVTLFCGILVEVS